MNAVDLGKRIKEARIAKKMTQSEVVGDFITRNMLSQIENGTATPSVKTLEYLARVLELPFEQLVGSDRDTDFNQLLETKALVREGRYDAAIDRAQSHSPELEDEFAALLARANLARAQQLAKTAPDTAVRLAREAIVYAGEGVYANSAIKAEGLILLAQLADQLGAAYLL